jgi:two-component system, chemotaxis family, chemotaxis protein CheY
MTFSGKVLIADDEAHIRKFVSLVLRSLGISEVHEAKNGAEALDLFRRDAHDLVLLDVNMPQLDGLQALAQIREKDPDVVVVMLTSVVNRLTVDECSRLGDRLPAKRRKSR